jgi:hypothetical protein
MVMADGTSGDAGAADVTAQRVEASAMKPAAVGRARRLVVERLAVWGCENTEDAALVLSELITNAVVHAGGAVTITVTRDGRRIRIEVSDNAPGQPRPGGPSPGGRGLHIVTQLSEHWGFHPTATGKLVWALVRCVNDHADAPADEHSTVVTTERKAEARERRDDAVPLAPDAHQGQDDDGTSPSGSERSNGRRKGRGSK